MYNLHIVQFVENGKYAIRKGYIFYSYLDIKDVNIKKDFNVFWWGKRDLYFEDCLTSDFKMLKGILEYVRYSGKGKVVL
jgi:hypothetical protein